MKYKKIVVIGGGILGSQIAYQTAYTGFDVTVLVRNEEEIASLKEKLGRLSWVCVIITLQMDKSVDSF